MQKILHFISEMSARRRFWFQNLASLPYMVIHPRPEAMGARRELPEPPGRSLVLSGTRINRYHPILFE